MHLWAFSVSRTMLGERGWKKIVVSRRMNTCAARQGRNGAINAGRLYGDRAELGSLNRSINY